MATYVNSLGQGSLFKSTSKKNDKSPDYTGAIGLLGGEYWIRGWLHKTSGGKSFIQLQVGSLKTPMGGPPEAADDAHEF